MQNEWVVAQLPFESLLLTGQGRIKETQRKFDYDQIKSIGLSIADGKDGPFALEIEYIRATHLGQP